MYRFFVLSENINGNRALIDPGQAHHIEKVLRLKPGEEVILFDGSCREYRAILAGRVGNMLLAEIKTVAEIDRSPQLQVNLIQGIPRREKIELIIQKAVEIGVSSIQPLLSQRTVVRLQGEKAEKKQQKWQVIAREACKQCGRNRIPEVKKPAHFREIISVIGQMPALFFYEAENGNRLKEVIRNNRDVLKKEQLFLIIGPEGGFSQEEVNLAREHKFFIVSLGSRILRSDTAGLVAASIIMYELGDLG